MFGGRTRHADISEVSTVMKMRVEVTADLPDLDTHSGVAPLPMTGSA
jgi:hypothetical protein